MDVLKVIEIIASSEKSWEDAAASAVRMAGKTVKEIRSVYIQDMSAVVTKNKITEYQIMRKSHLKYLTKNLVAGSVTG
jgi:flavin-binding protein dodecin